jgi:hypothetical protein
MISMIDTVGNALKNDTALKALISTRVHWIRPANTTTCPYITYVEAGNSESESADDEEYADDIEIQIDIWSKGSTIPIAREVQRIMRKLGFVHQALPETQENDTKIIHKPIRFMITKEI